MFSLLRENKENCSSPVDGGRREMQQAMPEVRGGGQREITSGKDVPFVQAKGGVVKVASGCSFMIGMALRRFRVQPYARY